MQYNSDSIDIPFAERLFTSRQAREILAEGKTKFFQESLPKLDAFLDGNKLKITGKSIQALIASRVKGGRKPRPTPSRRTGESKQLTA
jgi:hypothetical protein